MASTPTTSAALTMKLLVDTKARRVVYAEAGKEVVDFLFSQLALPLSAVAKLLAAMATTTSGASAGAGPLDQQQQQLTAAAANKKLPMTTTTTTATSSGSSMVVGSVGNLYRSVESLEAGGHVCRHAAAKDALLKPATATVLQLIAGVPALAPAVAPPEAPKPNGGGHQQLFRCKGCSCSVRCYDYATSISGTPCPVCKRKMTTEVHLVEPDGGGALAAADAGSGSSGGGGGGYVRDMVTYTVMDDLSVAPISTITAVTALVSLGFTDISGLEAKNVEIGYKEGLALLKASLQSQTVLTDVFLGPTSKQSAS